MKYTTITCRVNEEQYKIIKDAAMKKAKEIEIDINLAQFMRYSALKESRKVLEVLDD